jgi:hypothetical protein
MDGTKLLFTKELLFEVTELKKKIAVEHPP